MAKISSEAKKRYFDRVKEYKQTADLILQREQSILKTITGSETGVGYKRLTLADDRLNLASYYVLMNRLSLTLLGVKNEAFLNDARKSCYQSVIYLEETVSNYLDAPFSDYHELLEAIEGFEDEKRYALVRKLGFTIEMVETDFGDNSKWRWSFVELEGRFAVVNKNLIDFKNLVAGMDPRVPGYEARTGHLTMVKSLLQKSADRYRQKYELSTLRIDDFKRAIAFLNALRRVHMILGESDDAEQIKKKADVWRAKMNSDEQKAEQSGKKEQAKK
jgi:hypothetical protein